MNKGQKFIETKEFKRFAEFCDACIRYKYIGILLWITGCRKNIVLKVLFELGFYRKTNSL